jgi:hypothetical protein
MTDANIKIEKFSKRLFQFLGFHPILFPDQKKTKNHKLMQKLIYFWSFIIFTVTHSALAAVLYFGDFIFANDNTAGKANDMLKFVTLYAAFSITIVEKFLLRKKLPKIYERLSKFEEESKKLKINYESYWRAIRRSFSQKFVLTLVVSFGMEFLMLFSIGISKQWQYFWAVNLLPLLACRISHAQHIYYLTIIKFHSAIIRDQLQEMVDHSRKRRDFNNEFLERLQIIKNLYGTLHGVNTQVNEYFTFSLTANFVHEYIQCGCDSYWTYIAFTTEKVFNF